MTASQARRALAALAASESVSGKHGERTEAGRWAEAARRPSGWDQRFAVPGAPVRAAERRGGKQSGPISGPSPPRALRIGRSVPASLPAVGGPRRERPGIGAPAAPESQGRVRGLASAAGGLVSRGLEEELLATAATEEAGGGEGAETEGSEVEGIGSFWILYPVF